MAAKSNPTSPEPEMTVKPVEEVAAENPDAVDNPVTAAEFSQPSGAIIEPAVVAAVDVNHEAIDANPRANTTALQNAMDLNDAKRANPHDLDFAGQGIDLSVYGGRGAVLTDQTVSTDEGVALKGARKG